VAAVGRRAGRAGQPRSGPRPIKHHDAGPARAGGGVPAQSGGLVGGQHRRSARCWAGSRCSSRDGHRWRCCWRWNWSCTLAAKTRPAPCRRGPRPRRLPNRNPRPARSRAPRPHPRPRRLPRPIGERLVRLPRDVQAPREPECGSGDVGPLRTPTQGRAARPAESNWTEWQGPPAKTLTGRPLAQASIRHYFHLSRSGDF